MQIVQIEDVRILEMNTVAQLRSLAPDDERLGTLVEKLWSDQRRRADLDKATEKLELLAQKNFTATWRPAVSDDFTIRATIIQAHTDDAKHTVVCAKLDSGCDEDWISAEVLKRAGLEEQVELLQDQRTYVAFGGGKLTPKRKVLLTWYANNASKSRNTCFLVHEEEGPFDMVLGRVFWRKESIFMLNEPALALRQGKLNKGKCNRHNWLAWNAHLC